jgi:hypothetical protein
VIPKSTPVHRHWLLELTQSPIVIAEITKKKMKFQKQNKTKTFVEQPV